MKIITLIIIVLFFAACTPVTHKFINISEKFTPFMDAAKHDRIEDLVKFIENGEEIDKKTEYGWTALTFAVWENNSSSVKLLLEAGANPNISTKRIPGRSKSDPGEEPTTILTLAVANDNYEIIDLLLNYGAKVDPTAVSMAGNYGKIKILKKFKKLGADFNKESINYYYSTALNSAAMNHDYETAKWLLENGADPNFYASDSTPLSNALYLNYNFKDILNNKLIKLLLDNGADLSNEDNLRTVLISYLDPEGSGFILRTEGLEFLLSYGISPNSKFSLREYSEKRTITYYVISYIFNYCMIPDEPINPIYENLIKLLFENGATTDLSFYESLISEEPLQPKYKSALKKNKRFIINLIKNYIKKYSLDSNQS